MEHNERASRLAEVIDRRRYPLNDPHGATLQAVVARARRELADVGCCVLPNFLTPAAQERARAQAADVAAGAYDTVEHVNVYNTVADETLPDNHPARITFERGNAFVARDQIPPTAAIAQLYAAASFREFVAACFGLPALYELADPLSSLCLNVVKAGAGHPWHFDLNEFTVSMLVQQPERGGEFEYCPNLRSPGRENLDGVRDVLAGTASGRRLPLRPGDLQLFRGRYSLHRVTTVTGRRDRYSAIFAYSDRPGVVGTTVRAQQLFGRVSTQHRGSESTQSDGLMA